MASEKQTTRVALVTGGMGGLGEAICIKMAALGYYISDTDWIDFFNPEAAAFYWANERDRLLSLGVDCFWQDATEADPTTEITVDLEALEVRSGDVVAPFVIDDFTRWRLMEGLDDIGLTLRSEADITAFEGRRPAFLPTTP